MSHYYPRDPSVIGGDGNRRYPVAEEILSTPDNIHSSSSSSSSPRWHVEVPALTASEKSVVLAQYLHDHGRGGPYTAANTTNNNDWNNANKLLNEYCKFMEYRSNFMSNGEIYINTKFIEETLKNVIEFIEWNSNNKINK